MGTSEGLGRIVEGSTGRGTSLGVAGELEGAALALLLEALDEDDEGDAAPDVDNPPPFGWPAEPAATGGAGAGAVGRGDDDVAAREPLGRDADADAAAVVAAEGGPVRVGAP